MVKKAENVLEGMSNSWGAYAESKLVWGIVIEARLALLSVQLYRDGTQVLMYSSRTDPSTMCAPKISVDILKLYCKLEPINLHRV